MPEKTSSGDYYIEEDRDGQLFYEVRCSGPKKCGSFVSSVEVDRCPKCQSSKVTMRVVRKKIKIPEA